MSDSKNSAHSGQSAHSALYRKYRPQTFADVMGQEHILTALEGAVGGKRVAHAYLFSGSRGTGKTSIARIFARALEVSDNDVYEIDAASNRGIDDIREIRDGVNVLPFESPYKVYIVDEVHMLTKEAWNALLKTLEEPPSHAIFVLATTELEKIPETIISRCQVFSFKKPGRDILKNLVTSVAKKEGYTLESGVAELIAILGDGSFRDTLGTLQKVIGSADDTKAGGKKITIAAAEAITGAPRGVLVNSFVKSLVKDTSAEEALKILHTTAAAGVSMKTFALLVLEKFRLALLIKNAPAAAKLHADAVSVEDWKALEEMVKEAGAPAGQGTVGASPRLSSATLIELIKAYDQTGRTVIDSLPLEMAVLRIVGEGK